ncbi:MAG TPA: 3-phosphoglycerate dehydrogenase [Fimbriimonadaceae bacterium]|nr:3-phosphoglycerate dehydrogenase [Fimbriimonadaceae bacterium]
MKVLVADKFEQIGLDGLKALGVEVLYQPDLADESLGQAIRDSGAEALVVRSTKVSGANMEGSNLKLIVRAGAGYNTIDVAAASNRNILVTNCPGKNSQAVAELAFGLILALDRNIPDNVAELRSGKWNKKRFSKAKGIFGRTLGLVGMGTIGKEMVPRAKAFGMNVAAYSRHMSPEDFTKLGIAQANSLEELAEKSDIVSVHVSLTPETKNSLGADFFSRMRPGSLFVNTSRGEVVDQVSLIKAIEEKGIRAGLDVFADEPAGSEGDYQGALKDNPNVYCTHHIGASTDQAQEAVALETIRIVKEFKETGTAPNVVNPK